MNKFLGKIIAFEAEAAEFCRENGQKLPEILFATKYLKPEEFAGLVAASREAGKHLILGENRVQEAERKLRFAGPESRNSFTYFMIGNLQGNKVNKAVSLFDGILSVDSYNLAEKVSRKSASKENMEIFLEVNISGEKSKSGFSPDEVMNIIPVIRKLENISLAGLMTMPPSAGNPDDSAACFRKLKEIAQFHSLKTSMGTSQDWQAAVIAGTDMIRVGGSVFL